MHCKSFLPVDRLKLVNQFAMYFDIAVASRFLKKLLIVVVIAFLTWLLYKALIFDEFDPDVRRQAFREERMRNRKMKAQTTEKPSEPEFTPDSFYFPPADSFPD